MKLIDPKTGRRLRQGDQLDAEWEVLGYTAESVILRDDSGFVVEYLPELVGLMVVDNATFTLAEVSGAESMTGG